MRTDVAVFGRFISEVETARRPLSLLIFVQPADKRMSFGIVHEVEAFLVFNNLKGLSVVFVKTKSYADFTDAEYLKVEVRGVKLL